MIHQTSGAPQLHPAPRRESHVSVRAPAAMAQAAARRRPDPKGSPAASSATPTEVAAAARCAAVRSIGARRAMKVIGTAKSSGTAGGIDRPARAPARVARYQPGATGATTPA